MSLKNSSEVDNHPENPSNPLKFCKYCLQSCDSYKNPSLKCTGECSSQIHIKCLKSGGVPGSLAGDVFFHLYCSECSPLSEESITRIEMSWLNIIILALYNLRERSSGISKRGYFHYKSDICTFIDKNWNNLSKNVKSKNWMGTISGALSSHSPTFFQSGTAELGELGWWRLVDMDPPEILIDKNNKIIAERKKRGLKSNVSPTRSESSLSIGEDSCPEGSRIQTPSMFSREYVQPSEILSDYLMADDDMPDIDPLDIEDSIDMSEPLFTDSFLSTFNPEWMTNILNQAGNTQKPAPTPKYEENTITTEETSNDCSTTPEEAQNSLFTSSKPREYPWRRKKPISKKKQEIMSNNEIIYLLQNVNKKNLDSAPPSIRRLYRKLSLRKIKHDYNLPIFDLDKFTLKSNKTVKSSIKMKNRVIDRFSNNNLAFNFEQRLQGNAEPTVIHSPYTNRVLKPFIRRDWESNPLWLRVMEELLDKVKGISLNRDLEVEIKERGTIDYCYVRPQHIPAMNSLSSQFFWPGIDLTECLQYPDFTCVVLYKKIVIGFAILVPDVGYNEAYISFFVVRPEWRKCGIGTFMLYHLIQTCMGKDVTLHVSATNPALILYQKFGFKIEEFVQDFYDKYMAPGPRENRHAMFLRLSR